MLWSKAQNIRAWIYFSGSRSSFYVLPLEKCPLASCTSMARSKELGNRMVHICLYTLNVDYCQSNVSKKCIMQYKLSGSSSAQI